MVHDLTTNCRSSNATILLLPFRRFGGTVAGSESREYGHAPVTLYPELPAGAAMLFEGMEPGAFQVLTAARVELSRALSVELVV